MKQKVEIKAGSVILSEQPFMYVLNSKSRTERCDNCLEAGKLSKCSGCQYVYYCNRDCQRESWSVHKYECSNLRRISPRIIPNAARFLARIIVKLQKGGDQLKGYYTSTSFRKFKDLMSHYSDIKQDSYKMEHFASLCGVLFEYLGDALIPNSVELIGIYGRMCINSFNILDSEMNSIGTGIYLAASIVDHSCQPNAVAIFQGTTLNIRTLKTLSSLDFSQVFISYIDLVNTPQARREELKSIYYFWCTCSRCIDTEEADFMVSAACPNSSCDASVKIVSYREESHCAQCNAKITKQFVDEYEEVMQFTNEKLEEMKNVAYLDVCKVCLRKQQGILHPLNVLHVKVLDMAFESSVEMGLWDDAVSLGLRLIPGFKKYHGELHPLLGLLYLKLGKILVYQNKSAEALDYLKEAQRILKFTHGESHKLCKEILAPLLYQATTESSVI